MPIAILHLPTRVIRRLTTTLAPELGPEESTQVVPDGFDLAGGPWVLNLDGSRRFATTAEAEEAFSTPARQEIQDLVDALIAVRDGPAAIPAVLKTLATRFLGLYRKRVPSGE